VIETESWKLFYGIQRTKKRGKLYSLDLPNNDNSIQLITLGIEL
jgi:hypothetical protein